jgi:hypothetical protein
LSYKTRQLLHFEAFLNFGEGVRAVALINRFVRRPGGSAPPPALLIGGLMMMMMMMMMAF